MSNKPKKSHISANLKLSVTPLNTVIAIGAAIMLSRFLITSVDIGLEDGVLNYSEGVFKESVNPAVDIVNGYSPEALAIDISSPGGSVLEGKRFLTTLKDSGKHLITYTGTIAASMGADIFCVGDERVVGSEAVLLFHRGSAGGTTYNTLKNKLEVKIKEKESLEDRINKAKIREQLTPIDIMPAAPKLVPSNPMESDPFKLSVKPEDPLLEPTTTIKLEQELVSVKTDIEELEGSLGIMDALIVENLKRVKSFRVLAKDKAKFDEFYNKFKGGTVDITLTAHEALDLGIATKVVTGIKAVKKMVKEHNMKNQ